MRLQRMRVVPRHERHSRFESSGKVFLLRLEHPAQQAAPAKLARDTHRAVDITVVALQSSSVESDRVVAVEHFCQNRRARAEIAPERAQKSRDVTGDRNHGGAEIGGHVRHLLRRELG